MKTKYFIFFMLFLILPLTGCNSDEPDPNFPSNAIQDEDFKQYLLEQFDTNGDGVIDFNEAEAVRAIDCSDVQRSFTSLQGLEIFPNLEKLTLRNISGVDYLDISKNTRLKELYVNVALKALDISNNIELEKVACFGLYFETFDISKNIKLKELSLDNLAVKSLGTGSNVNLEKLFFRGFSSIESLDLSKNIQLKELCISGSKIEEIDLSNNIELKEFYGNSYDEKSLKKLDIFNNTNLEILDCKITESSTINLSQNKALRRFIINGVNISFIDISQNGNLEYFDFSQTNITNEIDIRHTKIDTLICNSLIKGLKANGLKTLKKVACSSEAIYIDLSESTVEEVSYYRRERFDSVDPASLLLNDCHSLKQFIFEQGSYSGYDTHSGALSIEAANCKSLEVFQSNFLASLKIDNCPALKDLKCVGTFEEIDLSGNSNVEKIACQSALLKTIDLTACKNLKEIICVGSYTGIDLSENKNLEKITLNSSALENMQITGFPKLNYLEANLSYKGLEINIKNNAVLETVTLANSDNDAVSYTVNLSNLPELKTVSVHGNGMEALILTDCQQLRKISNKKRADEWYPKSMLKFLEIDDCPLIAAIELESCVLAEVDVSQCPVIDTLSLTNNQLTSLKISEKVSYLDCSDNKLTSPDVSKNTGLQYFNCSKNPISSISLENSTVLKELVCSHTMLTTLDLHKNRTLDKLVCNENALLTDLILYAKYSFSVFQVDSHTQITYQE